MDDGEAEGRIRDGKREGRRKEMLIETEWREPLNDHESEKNNHDNS